MRNLILVSLLIPSLALAGFRDPIGSTGSVAQEIQAPRVSAAAIAPSKTTASTKPTTASRTPSSILLKGYAPPAPLAKDGKIPAAGALPEKFQAKIPGLNLPTRPTLHVGDPMGPMPVITKNHGQMLKFSADARAQKIPNREYQSQVRSKDIREKYKSALNPFSHRPIRTPLHISLAKIGKIQLPPAGTQYENMVKRLDALFDGFYLKYPDGIASLWRLSREKTNAENLQARDSLFAGILSQRAGWETVASNLWSEALDKKLDREQRYLGLLWSHIEGMNSALFMQRLVAKVNPAKVEKFQPVGDKANFALAKHLLQGSLVNGKKVGERISSQNLRDKLEIMYAIAGDEKGEANLRRIEKEGQKETGDDARLTLARMLLKKGDSQEALAFYQNVPKTTKNRLEVLGEQSYAEMKVGQNQDSLGKSVGLQSPYFQFGFSPDVHLVEILSRKSNCDFGGAEAGVKKLKERYLPELEKMQTVLAGIKKQEEFYPELISYHGLEKPMRFQRYLLHTPTVMENQKALFSAREELAKVRDLGKEKYTVARPESWNDFSVAMDEIWEKQGGKLKLESSRAAIAEMGYLITRLKQTFQQVELLDLDIATGAAGNFNLQSAMNFPANKTEQAEIDEEKLHWNFENEIWEDELEFLKMKNPSKCAARHASL